MSVYAVFNQANDKFICLVNDNNAAEYRINEDFILFNITNITLYPNTGYKDYSYVLDSYYNVVPVLKIEYVHSYTNDAVSLVNHENSLDMQLIKDDFKKKSILKRITCAIKGEI